MRRLKNIILGDFDNYSLKEKYLITIPIVACLGTIPAIFFNLEFNSFTLSLVTFVSSILFAIAYLVVRLFKLHRLSSWIVLLNAMSISSFSWILFEGSKGSAIPILTIVLIYCFLIFERYEKYITALLTILQLIVLMYIEFEYSHLLKTYETEQDRLIDIFITYCLSAFVIIYILQNLLKFYNIERERASRANYLKTIFLSNMSHEVRTPLNGILGFSRILKEGVADKTMEKKYLNIISNSGELLLSLVNDIIDLSKIESNTLVFNNEKTDIVPLMHSSIEFHNNSNLYKTEAVELRIELPDNLNSFFIDTDPARLLQVINNLLNNALKHTHQGFVELGIRNNFAPEKEEITIYVKDTGKGIPDDMKHKIFQRHVQVSSRSSSDHNAGLGLSIVSALLERMNGKIWVESELGKGSTFFFSLPVKLKSSR